jgi:hypothetical protein
MGSVGVGRIPTCGTRSAFDPKRSFDTCNLTRFASCHVQPDRFVPARPLPVAASFRCWRMTRTRKLETYKQHMVANGVGEATAFPPAWQLLWSVGLEIPPPPFLGFVSLALIAGGFFGPMFGLGAWLLGNRGVQEMPVTEALWVVLITGAAFGLIMATYYRRMARRHRLGPWAAFPARPGR